MAYSTFDNVWHACIHVLLGTRGGTLPVACAYYIVFASIGVKVELVIYKGTNTYAETPPTRGPEGLVGCHTSMLNASTCTVACTTIGFMQ